MNAHLVGPGPTRQMPARCHERVRKGEEIPGAIGRYRKELGKRESCRADRWVRRDSSGTDARDRVAPSGPQPLDLGCFHARLEPPLDLPLMLQRRRGWPEARRESREIGRAKRRRL